MRDFNEATRVARERLDAETMTASERARLERALAGNAPKRSPKRTWMAASAAVAVAAGIAVVVVLRAEPMTVGGFVLLSEQGACVRPVADGVEVSDTCGAMPRLAMDGAEAELAAGTTLVREQGELRLQRGRARFSVSKRKPGDHAFVVRVSDGAVVVTGTQFTVSQDSDSGVVAVTEGTVELRWANGEVSPVRAGESATWPRPAAKAEPPPESAAEPTAVDEPTAREPRRSPKATPQADANKVLRQLLQLRTQNRTDEALALLREARNNKAYTGVQRERFGFELCSVMTQTRAATEACACWKRHARDFPASARGEQVPSALEKCAH